MSCPSRVAANVSNADSEMSGATVVCVTKSLSFVRHQCRCERLSNAEHGSLFTFPSVLFVFAPPYFLDGVATWPDCVKPVERLRSDSRRPGRSRPDSAALAVTTVVAGYERRDSLRLPHRQKCVVRGGTS